MLQEVKRILNKLMKVGNYTFARPFSVTIQSLSTVRYLGKQLPPKNFASLPPAIQKWFEEEISLPEQLVYKLSDVRVSWQGVVFHHLELFIPSLSYPTYEEEFVGAFSLKQWVAKATTIEGRVGLVFDHWAAGNYYHWLVDALPRMLLLRKKHPGCTLLLPETAPEYVFLTAEALGFSNWQYIPKRGFVQAQELVMASHTAPPGKQDPVLLRQARTELNAVLGYKNAAAINPNRRVYVSRSKQKLRRLTNEAELLTLLTNYSIEFVYFEDLTFEQQIKLMQETELLVAVHGANMVNMLFMGTGTKVIELMNDEKCNMCYFHLSTNLELDYYVIPCAPTPGTGSADNHNSEDVTVDICLLEKTLNLAINFHQ